MEKLRYMHRNPVKRGLVELPEQWRWSSYRFYFLDEVGAVRECGVDQDFVSRACCLSRCRAKTLAAWVRGSRPCKNRKDGAPTVVMA